jgi:hypothetical protein
LLFSLWFLTFGLCPAELWVFTFWFLPFWVKTQKGKNQSFAGKGQRVKTLQGKG